MRPIGRWALRLATWVAVNIETMTGGADSDVGEAVYAFATSSGTVCARDFLEDALRAHPRFPSLLAVREALSELGIRTRAMRLVVTKLDSIRLPALVYLGNDAEPCYVVLRRIENGTVWYFRSGRRVREALGPFVARTSGVLLVREPSEEPAPSPAFSKGREVSRALPGLALWGGAFGLVAFSTACVADNVALYTALLALDLVGLGLSIILSVLHSIPTLTARYCPAKGAMSCDAVLSSPASRIFGTVPLSDVGVVYFLMSVVTTVLGAFSAHLEGTLFFRAWLALAVVPFSIWSLGYQAFRIRRFCLYCALVQLVLFSEAMLLPKWLKGQLDLNSLASGVSVLAMVCGGWWHLRALFMHRRSSFEARWALRRTWSTPQIVDAFLGAEPDVEVLDGGLDIPLSSTTPNEEPAISIVAILGPLCTHCAEDASFLAQMAKQFEKRVRLSVRLAAGPRTAPARPVARRVLTIARYQGEDAARQALLDWYRRGAMNSDFEAWSRDYPLPPASDEEEADVMLDQHDAWNKRVGVRVTPMFLIEARFAPVSFSSHELFGYIREKCRGF